MPTVILDEKSCAAEVGETILDVARRNGVWIPTLCYHPALEAYASCRLCMVEIDRGGWWQMVTACNYPVRRDLAVRVESERAVRARQGVMRLLLARAPESPELQRLAARLGIQSPGLPTVTVAERNCILCGLCVRACEERIGTAAISLAGRGVERKVSTPFDEPSADCILCGACAAVCPVGTIQWEVHGDEVELVPFGTRGPVRRCAACGAVLAAELAALAVAGRGAAAVQGLMDGEGFCWRCKRKKLARELSAGLPGGGPPSPRERPP
ncbi:MAG: 2Fe-2S iron-sulfur cluster-binding protein [Thermoguttaceae bacterium]|jgi:ferredoxin